MIDDFLRTKDNPSVRFIDTGLVKMTLKRTDPYGFWYVGYDKGLTPQELTGAFTTVGDAERAVNTYLHRTAKVPGAPRVLKSVISQQE